MRKPSPLRGKPRLPAKWPIAASALILSPEDEDIRRSDRKFCSPKGPRSYICGMVDGQWINLHRGIARRMLGRELLSSETVDHLNQDKQDNRRENLRVVPMSLNQHNVRQSHCDKRTPGPRGVAPSKNGKRWCAYSTRRIDGKDRVQYLGTFDTMEEATACYESHRRTLPGYVPLEAAING